METMNPADRKGMAAARTGVAGKALGTVIYALILLVSVAAEASAAFEGDVGLQGTWTDNLYLSASVEEDFITTPFGTVETNLGKNFSLLYNLNGYFYSSNSELNALWQKVAIRYNAEVKEKHALKAELGYSGILHVSDTNNLDHHQLRGIFDLNLRPYPRMLIKPGIGIIWRTYPTWLR